MHNLSDLRRKVLQNFKRWQELYLKLQVSEWGRFNRLQMRCLHDYIYRNKRSWKLLCNSNDSANFLIIYYDHLLAAVYYIYFPNLYKWIHIYEYRIVLRESYNWYEYQLIKGIITVC